MEASVVGELNFHSKPEVQRLQSGAGWPPLPAGLGIMPSGTNLLLDGLDSLLESVVSCSVFSTWFLGRLASLRPVGLALAHLGPLLLCHADQGLYVSPQIGLGLD